MGDIGSILWVGVLQILWVTLGPFHVLFLSESLSSLQACKLEVNSNKSKDVIGFDRRD